jgi:hypothetical protein
MVGRAVREEMAGLQVSRQLAEQRVPALQQVTQERCMWAGSSEETTERFSCIHTQPLTWWELQEWAVPEAPEETVQMVEPEHLEQEQTAVSVAPQLRAALEVSHMVAVL